MFYRLREDVGARRRGLRLAVIGKQPEIDLPWRMGIRFGKPVPAPVSCTLDPRGGPDLPDAFLSKRIPLFSARFIEALRNAGVDNLDCYPAELRAPDGSEIPTKYFATNVIGKIECVNLEASSFDPQSEYPMLEFQRIVVDDVKADGARMFRLAENPSFILVAEEVARSLDSSALIGVQLVPLDQAAAY